MQTLGPSTGRAGGQYSALWLGVGQVPTAVSVWPDGDHCSGGHNVGSGGARSAAGQQRWPGTAL